MDRADGCVMAGQREGWIPGLQNTCYILALKTLITVFISFLCNLFSFMVELTQVSRAQWFNAHVPFTCLVKHSKAPPLSKDVGISGVPVNIGALLIPIYNLHFLPFRVFQRKILFEKYPCNRSLKFGFMYYTCITYSCNHMAAHAPLLTLFKLYDIYEGNKIVWRCKLLLFQSHNFKVQLPLIGFPKVYNYILALSCVNPSVSYLYCLYG